MLLKTKRYIINNFVLTKDLELQVISEQYVTKLRKCVEAISKNNCTVTMPRERCRRHDNITRAAFTSHHLTTKIIWLEVGLIFEIKNKMSYYCRSSVRSIRALCCLMYDIQNCLFYFSLLIWLFLTILPLNKLLHTS